MAKFVQKCKENFLLSCELSHSWGEGESKLKTQKF